MTCIKGNWREKLFKLLPNLVSINKIGRDGKEVDISGIISENEDHLIEEGILKYKKSEEDDEFEVNSNEEVEDDEIDDKSNNENDRKKDEYDDKDYDYEEKVNYNKNEETNIKCNDKIDDKYVKTRKKKK